MQWKFWELYQELKWNYPVRVSSAFLTTVAVKAKGLWASISLLVVLAMTMTSRLEAVSSRPSESNLTVICDEPFRGNGLPTEHKIKVALTTSQLWPASWKQKRNLHNLIVGQPFKKVFFYVIRGHSKVVVIVE